MYISMVAIDATDSYEQHQAIWHLFPNAEERKRDHLFRVEGERDGRQLILLQSSSEPISCEHATVLQSKPYVLNITNGESYKFKLVANPTRIISKTKKVIEIKDEGEQVAWLQRKLQGSNVVVTAIESKLVQSRKSHTARFVTFEGVLQVLDADSIYSVAIMGIGRKKHAGAGLLSLARAN
ncbi:MAG: CRISPR system Cascade subunit CasE [Rubritalea sp.]|jgi:CRISPR system Cascade subunit CasE